VAGLVEAFEHIGSALEHHLPVTHAAGVALAVTDREETLGVVVRGFADVASGAPVGAETRFEIGSISKSFAAIVAMQEAEAGGLDLDVSINEHLPWLELAEPFGPITLHHLLTHSGGIAIGTEDAPTALGAATNLTAMTPTFAPGAHFWYSNDGYKLVGLVLERRTGVPIHELLRERVLAPLGMDATIAAITDGIRAEVATGYEPMYQDRPPQLSHPLVPAAWTVSNSADGSIVSNVLDMSAYARLLLNGGRGPDGAVLSEAAFRRLTERRIECPGDPEDYAYGLDVEKPGAPERILGHSGGMVGYTAYLITMPDSGLGCVVLQNGGGEKRAVARYALAAVRASLAGGELPPPPVPRDPEIHPSAAAFAGRYEPERGSDPLQIEAGADGRLRLRLGSTEAVLQQDPLRAPGDEFLVPHPDLERFALRFARDESGTVVEAFHGDSWFRGATSPVPSPEPPPREWASYPGVYRNNDPWSPVLRIVLRKGRLAAEWPADTSEESGGELRPLADGSFGVGDPWVPQRVRFERVVEGRATLAVFNEGRWWRSFEE
jgi:D-alanyl-D-alanine carboxypeptidase